MLRRLGCLGVAAGRDLYQQVGCVACHGSRDANGNPDKVTATSVPLGDLKAKYSIAGLAAFLENPLHIRPSGRMPKLLAGKEAHDVANYLLQGARVFCGRMLWNRVRNCRASSSRPNSIRARPRCSRISGFSGEMASARRSAFSASAGRSSEL